MKFYSFFIALFLARGLVAVAPDPFSNALDVASSLKLYGVALGESKAAIIGIGKETMVWQEGQENNSWKLQQVTPQNITLLNKATSKTFTVTF